MLTRYWPALPETLQTLQVQYLKTHTHHQHYELVYHNLSSPRSLRGPVAPAYNGRLGGGKTTAWPSCAGRSDRRFKSRADGGPDALARRLAGRPRAAGGEFRCTAGPLAAQPGGECLTRHGP